MSRTTTGTPGRLASPRPGHTWSSRRASSGRGRPRPRSLPSNQVMMTPAVDRPRRRRCSRTSSSPRSRGPTASADGHCGRWTAATGAGCSRSRIPYRVTYAPAAASRSATSIATACPRSSPGRVRQTGSIAFEHDGTFKWRSAVFPGGVNLGGACPRRPRRRRHAGDRRRGARSSTADGTSAGRAPGRGDNATSGRCRWWPTSTSTAARRWWPATRPTARTAPSCGAARAAGRLPPSATSTPTRSRDRAGRDGSVWLLEHDGAISLGSDRPPGRRPAARRPWPTSTATASRRSAWPGATATSCSRPTARSSGRR